MKKVILLSTLIAVSLVFTGCGKKDKNQAQNQEDQAPKGFEVKENNSLLGWLKRGKAVQCEVDSPEGKIKMLTKGDAVRIEGIPYMSPSSAGEMPQAENGVMLTTKEWTYMWDKKSKLGTKMNNQKMKEIGEEFGEEEQADSQQSWQDMVQAWEAQKVKYSCNELGVESSLLEEPTDVEFTDFTEVMSGMADIGKQMEAQIEAGEQPDMKALEDLANQLEKQGIPGINAEDMKMPQ